MSRFSILNSNGTIESPTESEKANTRLILVVLLIGLLIRLISGPFTRHPGISEMQATVGLVYVWGMYPFSWITSFGSSLYMFYLPTFVPYMFVNQFGVYSGYLLDFLFKIPIIVSDIIIFYCIFEIGKLLTSNRKKAIIAATAYFLNPFVLWLGTTGIYDTLMVAILLLSFLYLLRKRISSSAILLSLAVSFKYIPVLALPAFLVYLWRSGKSTIRFIIVFVSSSVVLFLPFLLLYIQMLLSSPGALMSISRVWLGHVASSALYLNAATFKHNFTGYLASLGLWTHIENILHQQVFLSLFIPLYLICTFLILYRLKKDHSFPSLASAVNKCIIVALVIAIVSNPVAQPQFLMWIFPFLIIEVFLLSNLSHFLFHSLWIVNILIDPVISGGFLYWFEQSFPSIMDLWKGWHIFPWPFFSLSLQLVLSVVMGLLYVIIIARCVFASRKIVPSQTQQLPSKHFERDLFLTALFVMYCALQILVLVFGIQSLTLGVGIFGLAICVLFALLISKDYLVFSHYPSLFDSSWMKVIGVLYLGSLITISILLLLFGFADPTPLFIQLVLLGTFWRLRKRIALGLDIQGISLMFTVIYVLYALLISKNILVGLITLPFLFSWIFLVGVNHRHGDPSIFRQLLNKTVVKLIKVRLRRRDYVACFLILLAVYGHLAFALTYSGYENIWSPQFTFYGNPVSSIGEMKSLGNGSIALGGLDYDGTSSVTWNYTVQIMPFMSEQMTQASETFLSISGAPISRTAPEIPADSVGWRDENFTEGWAFFVANGLNESRAVSDGFSYSISSDLEAGRSYYLMSKTVPALSTDEYQFFAVRWNSTSRIVRVDVEYADGIADQCVVGSGRSSDNGFSSEWRTTIFKLPSNRTVKEIIVGIDDTYDWLQTSNDVMGSQTVSFSQVMFFSGSDKSSQVKITLNGQQILDESLDFEENGSYTLPPNKYSTWTRPDSSLTSLKIPLDIDKLKLENSLNITVTEGVQLDISSVTVFIVLYMSAVSPMWSSNVGFIFLIFVFDLSLIVIFLWKWGLLPKRLLKWGLQIFKRQ